MGLTKRELFPQAYKLFDKLLDEAISEMPTIKIRNKGLFHFDEKLRRLISATKPRRYINLKTDDEINRYKKFAGENKC